MFVCGVSVAVFVGCDVKGSWWCITGGRLGILFIERVDIVLQIGCLCGFLCLGWCWVLRLCLGLLDMSVRSVSALGFGRCRVFGVSCGLVRF